MSERCWVEISGAALRSNLKYVRQLAGKSCEIMGVVKANAYGHGLVGVGRELQSAGIDWLAVSSVKEAAQLRDSGVTLPVLLLSACLAEEMPEALRLKATVVLSDLTEARALAQAARAMKTVAEAHLKIDTGMGRLGAWHEEAAEILARMEDLEGLKITGLCTHFARADDDAAMTRSQWKQFLQLQPLFGSRLIHAANSPALSRFTASSAQAVRAGLMLYGVGFTKRDQSRLIPAMTWKARVTFLREVPAGRTISYGASYKTPRRERLATITAGYGDGYFRANSNRACVLIGGVRCPIRGRVTMDQIVVDVTRVPEVKSGDEAVLLGRQGKAEITVQELADQVGTIPWEILTNVSSRVDRQFIGFRSKVL